MPGGIEIQAKHILGNLNADSFSRRDKVNQTEWALNSQVFVQLNADKLKGDDPCVSKKPCSFFDVLMP